MNGSAAKSARRGIRRAVNGEAVDLLERHEIIIEALKDDRRRHETVIDTLSAESNLTAQCMVTMGRDLTHHLTGLSRWQRLRWVLKL